MKLIKRIICATTGVILLGLTTGICIKTSIGSGSMGVFLDGLSRKAGISVGTAGLFLNSILIIGLFIVDKKRIGIFTIICMFLSKIPTDLAMKYFVPSINLFLNIIICFVSTFFMAMGSALVIKADLGNGAYDGFAVAVSKRLNVRYTYVGYTMSAILLSSGYVLGGIVGIGTIISLVCYSPMLELSMKILKYK